MATGTDLTLELQDPDVLSEEEESRLLRGAPWRRFVVVGDSVARGLGERIDGYGRESWGERVANAIRRESRAVEYLNLGQPDALAHEVRREQIEPAVDFGPDLAALVCGGNDLLNEKLDTDGLEEDLDAIVGALAGTGADVVTYTMYDIAKALKLPPEFGAELDSRLEELYALVRRTSRRHGAILVELTKAPVSADPGIYSRDFKHGNTRGQAIAASLTIRELGRHLGNT